MPVNRPMIPARTVAGQMPATPVWKYCTVKTLDGEPAGTANSGVPVEAWWSCSTRPLTHGAKRPLL
jgi:hypothetical protein